MLLFVGAVPQVGEDKVSGLLSHSLEGELEAGSNVLSRLGHLPCPLCHASLGSALYSVSPWMVERLQG